jgi:hypothetical protein
MWAVGKKVPAGINNSTGGVKTLSRRQKQPRKGQLKSNATWNFLLTLNVLASRSSVQVLVRQIFTRKIDLAYTDIPLIDRDWEGGSVEWNGGNQAHSRHLIS